MKNKLIKIIILILIILSVFNSYKVYADDYTEEQIEQQEQEESESALEQFKPTLKDEDILTSKASKLLGYINVIGVVIAVMAVVAIGIKYMLGSVEERADYKKTAITYLIGAFLIFSVTTIPNILYQIGQSFSGYEENDETIVELEPSKDKPNQFIK